jgi:DNA gyrase inhibitor GyrI
VRFDDENDVSLLKVETLNLSFYMFSFWRREKTRQKEEENSLSVVWAPPRALPCAIAKQQRFSICLLLRRRREKERKKERPVRWELFY